LRNFPLTTISRRKTRLGARGLHNSAGVGSTTPPTLNEVASDELERPRLLPKYSCYPESALGRRLLLGIDGQHRAVDPFEIRDVRELNQDPAPPPRDINLDSRTQSIR
jgi:hypothetical protein